MARARRAPDLEDVPDGGSYIDLRADKDGKNPHYVVCAEGNDAVLVTSETYTTDDHLLRAVEDFQRLIGSRLPIRDSRSPE